MKDIEVTINGNKRRVESGATVAKVLTDFDTANKRVAVERNGEIVPKSMHASTDLLDGDRLEIVVAVGGG